MGLVVDGSAFENKITSKTSISKFYICDDGSVVSLITISYVLNNLLAIRANNEVMNKNIFRQGHHFSDSNCLEDGRVSLSINNKGGAP